MDMGSLTVTEEVPEHPLHGGGRTGHQFDVTAQIRRHHGQPFGVPRWCDQIQPPRIANGGDAVLSSSRPLQTEQLFLSLKAPTVACKIAVFPNDAMAGNGDRDAVRGTGSGHGTGSRRLPN